MKPKPKPKPKSKSKPSKESPTTSAAATEAESTPAEFSLAVARIAVAQICKSVGFRSTQLSALETLTHVATKYLEAIAKSSASFAAASNRSQSNLFDVTNALHDLGSLHGFSGASNLHKTSYCLLSSTVLADLSDFVYSTAETPFAKPIPRPQFGSPKIDLEKKKSPSPLRAPHVPNWLPEPPPDGAQCWAVSGGGRRRNGEELWENTSGGIEIGGVVVIENEAKRDLGAKRERVRVRFKIGGSELNSGGKRVCWYGDRNGYKNDYTSIIRGESEDKILTPIWSKERKT